MVNVEYLRSASEEELMRLHNEAMHNRAAHYYVFLDELARREAERQGERMEALTRSMNRFAGVGVAVPIVGVVLSLLTLLSG